MRKNTKTIKGCKHDTLPDYVTQVGLALIVRQRYDTLEWKEKA